MATPSPATEGDVRTALRRKSWFGFDLDDTLHEFRVASGAAITHCFERIAARNSRVSLKELQASYQEYLKSQGAPNAFTDGKTSEAYRRERVIATLDRFGLDHGIIDELLTSYERVLVDNLRLKPGTLSLLRTIKSLDKKIVVITEGPQDAQERALHDLGISQYVDFLATTNFFKVSKVDGLFTKVLDQLKITPDDIVYIGDSLERDVLPANESGIYAIHLNEKQPSRLSLSPLAISSLSVLDDLLLNFG